MVKRLLKITIPISAIFIFAIASGEVPRQDQEYIKQVDLVIEGQIRWQSQPSRLVSVNPTKKLITYLNLDEKSDREILLQKDLTTGGEKVIVKNDWQSGLGEILDSLSVSRDGTKVAFQASGITYYYPSDIYFVNSDGSGLKKLTKSIEGCQRIFYDPEGLPGGQGSPYCTYHGSPLISPDGKRVLFTRRETRWVKGAGGEEEDKYFHSLCVVNSDGSSFKKLDEAEDKDVGRSKVWSTDSQRIYYFEIDGQIPGPYPPLYIVEYDLEKGAKSRITEVPRRSDPPFVLLMSPAEEKVYYYSDSGLTEYHLLTRQKRAITKLILENLAVSPSGDKLVGCMDNRLYLIRITDGRATALEVAAKRDPLELSKLRPVPRQVDQFSPAVRGQLRIQSLQWVDERRILCVIANDKVQKIGILTLSP